MPSIARAPRSAQIALFLAGALSGLAGCAQTSPRSQVAPVSTPGLAAADAELPPLAGLSAEPTVSPVLRHVGDLSVHRFFGSYAKQPLTLSERVVGREDDVWIVDYELEQGASVERMRVRRSVRSDRVTAVSRMLGELEVPTKMQDYEAWLGRTSFVPDRNAGPTGEARETCLVGPREFECEVAHYRVFVDQREASLTVKKSAELGGDVAGEVVALDGTVIYAAELIERTSGADGAEPSGTARAER